MRVIDEAGAKVKRDAAIARAHANYEADLKYLSEARCRVAALQKEIAEHIPRLATVLQLLRAGKTKKQISERLGLGTDRVAQLIREGLRREAEGSPLLSPRAYNVIINSNLPLDPAVVAGFGVSRLMNLPNMGRKTATEISVWVSAAGFKMTP